MNKMKFKVEQIALYPNFPKRAFKLLHDLGAEDWINDSVKARGKVFEEEGENTANLSFNYDLEGAKELEVLEYVDGPNWVESNSYEGSVSHLGMHCTAEELVKWREFFKSRGIPVAQEVFTKEHSNEYLNKVGRKFNYVIFDTRPILGVDLKFIVRIQKDQNVCPVC